MSTLHDGARDFDFYYGRWNVHNERLRERLTGSTDWEHFEATQECHPILGGLGNIDDFVSDWNRGEEQKFLGMTLRLFNPATQEWSLYWSSNRTGVLEPPVVGRFEHGVGRFIGKDQHQGKPVLARFIWSEITPDSAKWEQALSADDGKTWETNWIMRMTRVHDAGAGGRAEPRDAVVELRQYTLHPGQRDTLIELFEREFIESQEACGLRVLGQFRDLDNPDRFVWLRGFDDMPGRAQALAAFYDGPVWKTHRDAANATMIDSDNVLLLRPASAQAGFARDDGGRADAGVPVAPAGLVVATVWPLRAADADFVTYIEQHIVPRWRAAGARVLACFVSEHSENTFPALPVRTGENLCVSFCAFDNAEQHAAHRAALERDRIWRDEIAPELHRRLAGEPETLRLVPTPRSRLRG